MTRTPALPVVIVSISKCHFSFAYTRLFIRALSMALCPLHSKHCHLCWLLVTNFPAFAACETLFVLVFSFFFKFLCDKNEQLKMAYVLIDMPPLCENLGEFLAICTKCKISYAWHASEMLMLFWRAIHAAHISLWSVHKVKMAFALKCSSSNDSFTVKWTLKESMQRPFQSWLNAIFVWAHICCVLDKFMAIGTTPTHTRARASFL